jgi:uncharacterized glyoxalase superfamily metalloenzyme YdcJ
MSSSALKIPLALTQENAGIHGSGTARIEERAINELAFTETGVVQYDRLFLETLLRYFQEMKRLSIHRDFPSL